MTSSAMEFLSDTQVRLRVREATTDGKSLAARTTIYLTVENDSPVPLTRKDARRLGQALIEMAEMNVSRTPVTP